MTEILRLLATDITPSRGAVLENQGVPAGASVSPEIEALCSEAMERLVQSAQPIGVLAGIVTNEFAGLFEGEGENEADTPVGDIYPLCDSLAIFAVTLGETISREIDVLFQTDDFALGCMLDAAASAAADMAAAKIEQEYARSLTDAGKLSGADSALRYSPGYCGWHISGQKKLFSYLQPEQIGLKLRDTYLMEPLKSVSGVIIAGPREIHEFDPSYPSCAACETYSCRDRIRALYA